MHAPLFINFIFPILLHLQTRLIKGEDKIVTMSEPTSQPPSTGPDGRPLGPDGKPLPGPQQMQQVMAQRRMAQQQAQVDEVVGIMRNNVEKAGVKEK